MKYCGFLTEIRLLRTSYWEGLIDSIFLILSIIDWLSTTAVALLDQELLDIKIKIRSFRRVVLSRKASMSQI